MRWKGKYSEKDTTNWTPELQKALSYDPKSAQMFDNGEDIFSSTLMLFNLN